MNIQFVLGVLVTFAFVIIISILPASKISKYNAAINECELKLPRSQQCTITAIPEDIDQ
jgi:hypothetical protein